MFCRTDGSLKPTRALLAVLALCGLACGSEASPPGDGAEMGAGWEDGAPAEPGGAARVGGDDALGTGGSPPTSSSMGGGPATAQTTGGPTGGAAPEVAERGGGGETTGPGPSEPDPAETDVDVVDCDPAQALAPGDHVFTLLSANGLTYEYVLVVPEGLEPGHKAPLALVWHALWSSPEETRALTHVDETMAALGTLSVHPRSPDQSWDVGSCCTGIVLGKRRDETVFVRELLRDVTSKVCVDAQRIYTSGFSNGGMMSQLLACEMADVFAAAAPMGSTLTIPTGDCHPSRPIPILLINGTADPLVPYGAPGLAGGLSVPNAFETWAAQNGCSGEPETTVQQGKATCRTYTECAEGAEVTLCSVEGMGHCVPGMKAESPLNCLTKNLIPLGMPNDDIDGVDLSAEFVSRYSLP